MSPNCSRALVTLCLVVGLGRSRPAAAQHFPINDAVIKRLWDEGMTERSQAATLAQALMDSIGPRLTASRGHEAAIEWLLSLYQRWGVPARKEKFGTWLGWRRDYTHLDLIAPRQRSLEGTMLAWSPGTNGPVEGDAVLAPDVADSAAFESWLPKARGKFVLMSFAEPSCRPDENWDRLARPESIARFRAARDSARRVWGARTQRLGRSAMRALDRAGAAGILTSLWSAGWGVTKIFAAHTEAVPVLDLSCEDYGLVFRLAERNQGPRLRLDARSASLGEQPMFNVIGELKGTEKPEEYVVLSAHLDSWDGASGATDNGTGTITMLEAMRLLALAYPRPKRTIIVGHWGGEELGLLGSRSYATDHPEIVNGLQAAFNQDNGTWRIEYIRMMGLTGAGAHFGRWISAIPPEIAGGITLDIPGEPERGGSDHMAFLCSGAPAFRLQSNYPDYRQYTWHTNRDTFDKLIIDDLKNNATLAAMLAYQAAEDPGRVPRDRRILSGPDGQPAAWPACSPPERSYPR
jgi:hypothetical protein